MPQCLCLDPAAPHTQDDKPCAKRKTTAMGTKVARDLARGTARAVLLQCSRAAQEDRRDGRSERRAESCTDHGVRRTSTHTHINYSTLSPAFSLSFSHTREQTLIFTTIIGPKRSDQTRNYDFSPPLRACLISPKADQSIQHRGYFTFPCVLESLLGVCTPASFRPLFCILRSRRARVLLFWAEVFSEGSPFIVSFLLRVACLCRRYMHLSVRLFSSSLLFLVGFPSIYSPIRALARYTEFGVKDN
jgi:hypothetical protein